jgi:hypothetical protein
MLCPVNHADDYPPHLKHLAPTDADLDTVLEEHLGKPVDKGSAAANVTALQQRITQYEAERARLLENQAKLPPEKFHAHLASYDADLTKARRLLADYKSQLDASN